MSDFIECQVKMKAYPERIAEIGTRNGMPCPSTPIFATGLEFRKLTNLPL